MITSVRFPHSIEVLSDMDSRSTWKPGQYNITRITRDAAGILVFDTNKDGVRINVYPPPGTVVSEDDNATICTLLKAATPLPGMNPAPQVLASKGVQVFSKEPNGPTSSEPSEQPARPIAKKPRR